MIDSVLDTRGDRKYEAFPSELKLPKNVTLEALYYDWEGFRILVRDYDKAAITGILRISFGTGPIAHRCMDEGVYPASWSTKKPSFLSIVKNSEYLEWFHMESGGIRQNQDLVHYAVYTVNECVDVIDLEPPKVEWL